MTFHYRAPLLLGFALAAITLLLLPTAVRSFSHAQGWAFSDLHINYAFGLVRRGLLGEIAYQLRTRMGVETTGFFGLLFLAAMVAQTALLAILAWPLRNWPPLFLVIMLSPALLLFPAYDYGAYLRKDIFIALGLLLHGLMARGARRGTIPLARYHVLLWCVMAPWLVVSVFIHEIQLFFLPAHLALVGLALGGFKPSRRTIGAIAAIVLPAGIAVAIVIAHRGNAEAAQAICQSWNGLAEVSCSAIEALAWPLSTLLYLDWELLRTPVALAVFAISLLLTLAPCFALRAVAWQSSDAVPAGALLALAALPTLALFALGWDWGRWISLIGLMLICLFLTMPPVKSNMHRQLGRLGSLALWVAAFAYLTTWKLNHCCQPTSLESNVLTSLMHSLALLFS